MPVIPATQKVEIRRIDKFCGLTVSWETWQPRALN
jgi:hypothetical protein